MTKSIEFNIQTQPDDTTCGPSCLASVFRYYGDEVDLQEVIRDTPALEEGGTLAVLMGTYALSRGYRVRIITYNLRVFDPSWFDAAPVLRGSDVAGSAAGIVEPVWRCPAVDLVPKLEAQRVGKKSVRLQTSCLAYVDYLRHGGEVLMCELNGDLIRFFLDQGKPVMTGLSSTWLYQAPRQIGRTNRPDDVRGEPEGHFVVLSGYNRERKMVHVADPWLPNPLGGVSSRSNEYDVGMDRLLGSIMLGVLTYDANLMIIEPAVSAG